MSNTPLENETQNTVDQIGSGQLHPDDAKNMVKMFLVVSGFETALFGGVIAYSYITYGAPIGDKTIPLLIGVVVITMPLLIAIPNYYKRKTKQRGMANQDDPVHRAEGDSTRVQSSSIIRRD